MLSVNILCPIRMRLQMKTRQEYIRASLSVIISRAMFILAVSIAALALTAPSIAAAKPPAAVNGILDLTGIDLNESRSVKLDGQWEFYWNRLLEPRDFESPVPPPMSGFISLPNPWNGYLINGEPLSGEGFATFRLTVKQKNTGSLLGFRVPYMSTAYKLWVNGRLVSSGGTIGKNRDEMRPQELPRIAYFSAGEETLRIVVQVSNFHHIKGGIRESLLLGSEKRIQARRDRQLAFDIFQWGVLLIMGLYHLALYALRKKDPSTLYFGIFCLIISLRVVLTGEHYLIALFPGFSWEIEARLEYLTLYLGPPIFLMFIRSLYPFELSGFMLRVFQALAAVFCLVIIITPARIFSHTLLVYEGILVLSCVYAIYCIVRAIARGREGALIFIIGFTCFFATIINDILFNNEIIHTGHIVPFGLVIFIFSQSFILSRRFSRSFALVELMSQELESTNHELIQIDRLKDEFLANTSHELQTPLNGIIGIAESLCDGAAGELPGAAKHNLSMIITSGRRLSNLINDILDFSKLKNRDIQLRLTAVDVRSAASIVMDLLRSLADRKGLRLVNSIPANTPPVWADENRLQQILHNLLGNAIKFTDEGRVEISAVVPQSGNSGSRQIEISVADTGIGIAPENIPRVFEAFEQVNGSVSRNHGGTGIGLSITKRLVELHHGSIRVESHPGKGSVFTFSLPAASGAMADTSAGSSAVKHHVELTRTSAHRYDDAEMSPAPEASFVPPEAPAADRSGQFKILAVDDDPVNLQVLENHLSLQNYSVLKSLSGLEALALIESGLMPDLILLDVMMPRMSGYEVSRKLREKYSIFDLPIMMLTVKNQIADVVSGLQAGANDYLSKPFDKRELLARVNTLITLKEAVRESKRLLSIEQEIDVARRIQRSAIPVKAPELPGFSIAARYIPMEKIGGDFYDFHILDDKRIGVIVTDVSGHGVPAALIASMVKIVFYMQKHLSSRPDTFLEEMNRILSGNIEKQFLTAAYTYFDLDRKKLYYANAGHEPLIILRNGSLKIESHKPRGRIIGWMDEIKCEMEEIDIGTGDRIILYTDGITEVYGAGNEMFGENALYEIIRKSSHLDASSFADRLLDELKQWAGKDAHFHDDITLVIIDIR